MNTKGVEDGMGEPPTIGDLGSDLDYQWSDAQPESPTTDEEDARADIAVVWIDPRTKEPCRRCNGTGKMPPWPGSNGLVACGVCREEERASPQPPESLQEDGGGTPTKENPLKEYRKTATIRAIQYLGQHVPGVCTGPHGSYDETAPHIHGLEGDHSVTKGDWIATGIQGEQWALKPDVFAATYEEVAPEPVADGGGLPLLDVQIIKDTIEIGKDDGDIATIHVDRLSALLAAYALSEEALEQRESQLASSQEALRLAREGMQHAVEKLKDVQGRDGFDNKQLTEAISLLLPEGSSRP